MLLDLKKLINKYNLNIKGVIHIGAHHGQENKTYDEVGIKNRIFFEPLESNFKTLKNNISNEYVLINKALGNEEKDIKMFVESANMGQSSSILKPKLHKIQYPHIKFESEEIVKMVKLDNVEFNREEYNFINIDVQGYELEVFKGGKKTLESIDYVMSEINREELYENCAKVDELIEFLSEYEFELVEEDWAGRTWGDGLFIKKSLT